MCSSYTALSNHVLVSYRIVTLLSIISPKTDIKIVKEKREYIVGSVSAAYKVTIELKKREPQFIII